MYIDKIYTKLYSNKDWNGLEQLISEIRKFSGELNQTSLNALDKRRQRLSGVGTGLTNLSPDFLNKTKLRDGIDKRIIENNDYQKLINGNDSNYYQNKYNDNDDQINSGQLYRQERAKELWNDRNNWSHRVK